MWKWACRRHSNKNYHWIKSKYFKHKGNQNWVFTTSDKGTKSDLPRFDATQIVRHTKIKCQSNPYDNGWNDYFKEREKKRFSRQKLSVN